VAALCAQIVKNDQGVWVSSVNTVSWQKVYVQGINAVGMQMVAAKVADILSQNAMWKAMTSIQHNAVQGPEMLSFVTTTLNGLSEYDYYELNTIIVLYGLQVMEQRGAKWVIMKDDKGNPFVSSNTWQPVKVTPVLQPLLVKYPGILKYRGGVQIMVQFPEKKGEFKNALLSQSLLREVQGSDNSCISLLSAMRGYSGMTDEFGRRIQFLVSSVLHCWSIGRKVTIQLQTVGDLPILVSSTNYWKRQVELKGFEVDGHMNFILEQCEVKFLLPGISDKKKVVGSFQVAIVNKPVPGSVVVMYDPGTMPTAESKGKVVDYDAYSRALFPSFCDKHDFIFYSIIFGDYPFSMDKDVVRERHSMTVSFRPLLRIDTKEEEKKIRDLFVYRHGTASGFRGVVSSFEISLIGYGVTPLYSSTTSQKRMYAPSGHDMIRKTLHRIPLERVCTRAEWYDRIILDCEGQSVIFGCPVMRYSGISNLVYQSKIAAALNLSLVPLEDGVSSGLLAIRRGAMVVEEVVDFTPRETTVQVTTATTEMVPQVMPLIASSSEGQNDEDVFSQAEYVLNDAKELEEEEIELSLNSPGFDAI